MQFKHLNRLKRALGGATESSANNFLSNFKLPEPSFKIKIEPFPASGRADLIIDMELIKLPGLRHQRLILALCTVIAFGGSLGNGYAVDDENVTTADNVRVAQGFAGIGAILTSEYDQAGFDGTDGYGYRPLPMITFVVEKELFGFNPRLSHAINLLIYLTLLWVLFNCLRGLLQAYPPWVPFFTVLFFALHPLHTEVVNSLKNREELLVSLFGFLALLHFLRYTERPSWRRLMYGFFMMAFGVLCKATLAPFMLVIPLLLWAFDKLSLKKATGLFLAISVSTVLVYFLPTKLMGIDLGRETYFFENPLAFLPAIERLPTALYTFVNYLKLHFFPYPLLSYYGFDQVAILHWRQAEVYIALVIMLGLGLCFFYSIKRNKLFAMGLLIMVLFLAPYLNFPIAVPGMIAERFAFNSILGLVLMLMGLIYQNPFTSTIRKITVKLRTRVILLVVTVLVTFVVLDIQRSGEWKDFYTLMKADAGRAPDSFKLNMLHGDITQVRLNGATDARERAELIEEAISAYKNAISIYPAHSDVYNNLGVVYTLKGDFASAIPYLLQAVEKGQSKAETYFNLGACYEMVKRPASAKTYYDKALDKDPGYAPALERLKAMDQ